jgi:SH3 domain
MSAKKLRVLYDFKAEEEGEVSVKAGDVLSLIDDSNADRDGWVLVELTHNGASGFVPAGMLEL